MGACMNDFFRGFGGAAWLVFLAFSAIVTVVSAFGLPSVVDTANPWVLLLLGAAVFVLAFVNGWKQRGIRNERDIRLENKLESERQVAKTESDAAVAKINAEKDIEIERIKQEFLYEKERKAQDASIANAEIERDRQLRQFSKIQLEYIQKCHFEEKHGGKGITVTIDDPIAETLSQMEVFHYLGADASYTWCTYDLTPKWRVIVSSREGDIDTILSKLAQEGL